MFFFLKKRTKIQDRQMLNAIAGTRIHL